MAMVKLGEVEARFARIIWDNEPITTARLVQICKDQLNWKRTTTYTVLKRLSDRGLFQNQDGVVTSLISREGFCGQQSREFVEETFDGSLPAFLAAFASRKKLTRDEVEEIRRMIDSYEEG